MDLVLRLAILGALVIAGSLCFVGSGYLAWLWTRPPEIRINQFSIAGAADKGAISAVAKILREDLNDISEAASWDPVRSRAKGPSLPEGALGRRLPVGGIATESALKFKISDFEVIGLVDRVVQMFRRGPSIQGTIVPAGERIGLAAEYADSGAGDRIWFSPPQPDLRAAVRELAYQIVWDLHRANSPELQSLELKEFRALIDARKALQKYAAVSATAGKPELESLLDAARSFLQPVAEAGTRSIWVYKYLGAIHVMLEDRKGARDAFGRAAALAPDDPFVQQHLSAIQAAAAAPITPSLDPLATQPALRQVAVDRALELMKGARNPVVVGQLDTGLQKGLFPPGRVVEGRSFIPSNPGWEDDHGHGTALASLVFALCPTAKLLPIKVLSNTGSGQDSGILAGLDAAAHGSKVILLGFGSPGPPRPVYAAAVKAIVSRGGMVVAAAGNEPGTDRSNPAGLDDVISVAAVDENGKLAAFTTYGTWVTLAAPGVNVETYGLGGVKERMSGTTFSATIVAAVVASMVSVNPSLTLAQVKEILIKTSTPLAPGDKGKLAGGVVNAAAAVQAAMGH